MNKESEDKLTNAIIALHEAIEKQGVKMNLALSELRTSYMKLDERVAKLDDSVNAMRSDLNGKIDSLSSSLNNYAKSNNAILNNHETRISRLENRPSIVSEPIAKYKTKKRK